MPLPLDPLVSETYIPWAQLARFVPTPKPVPWTPPPLLQASVLASSSQPQEILGGSGFVKLRFDKINRQIGNHFNPVDFTWTPPAGEARIVLFNNPYFVVFIAKNEILLPIPYSNYIVDYANGSDVYDARILSLPPGKGDFSVWDVRWYGYSLG
jgi:hypothetical protein